MAFLPGTEARNWSSDSELCTQQQDATARPHRSGASLKPPWVLAWHHQSFTEVEVLKQVRVTFWEKLAADKSMNDIIASVFKIVAFSEARRVRNRTLRCY